MNLYGLCYLAIELVTPPLDDIILPGVTRDSVLALARNHVSGKTKVPELTDKLVVSERSVAMKEVKDAAQAGTLVEFFGTGAYSAILILIMSMVLIDVFSVGTAAVISPVDRIGYLGEDVHLPTGPDGMGPVSRPIWTQLVGIQMGTISHGERGREARMRLSRASGGMGGSGGGPPTNVALPTWAYALL